MLRVGIALPPHVMYDRHADMLVKEFEAAGCHAVRFTPGQAPGDLDLLLLASKGRDLESHVRRLPHRAHRSFKTVLWQWDPLPPPGLQEQDETTWMRLASFDLDRLPARFQETLERWVPYHAKFTHRQRDFAARLACYVGRANTDVFEGLTVSQIHFVFSQWAWIRRQVTSGRIDLVLGSAPSRVEFLRNRGVPTGLVPIGYHNEMGTLLDLPRDVDVLFIGRARRSRRVPVLAELEQRLEALGVPLTFAPRNCYGDERTRLVNRARIVVNILNYPWDLTGLRFLMAMSCGALVVTEKLDDSYPYRPGENLVEAPLEKMAETVAYYLNHEDERAAVAAAGHRFATEENTIQSAIRKILELSH
jgi:hypothetical protein